MSGGFDSLGLMAELVRSINDLGWQLPTDVQDESIPLILGGGDVMVAAETGSGKTAAFCLPIIQCVYETLKLSTSVPNEPKKDIAGSGEVVKMNDDDKDQLLNIHSDEETCQSSDPNIWNGGRANYGVKSGKYYFECHVKSTGICRVGWSTKTAHLELGKDSYGYGFGGTGKKSFKNTFQDYGEQYGSDDVIGCCLDYDALQISYTKNETNLGTAFTLPSTLKGTVLFPAILLKKCTVKMIFHPSRFKYPIPHGFKALSPQDTPNIISSNSSTAFIQAGKRTPLAIIIEPARDLAEQVYQNIQELSRYVSNPVIKPILLVGGDDPKTQQRKLQDGIDIVVATVGKAEDMLKRGALDLSMVRFFVLDEADRLTEPESLASVLKLFAACPRGGTGQHRLQVCFFSATLHSPEIIKLGTSICNHPTWVDLKGVDSVPETVHHVIFPINPSVQDYLRPLSKATLVTDEVHLHPLTPGSEEELSQKLKQLKLLALVGIIDHFKMSQCMIFCRTNVDCNNLETFLNAHGGGGAKFSQRVESGKENPYSCAVLAGMRSMTQRRASLEAFKAGDVRFLICTDVAARGIDVVGLPFIVNMTLPDSAENYIHRIGRVGRAERMGLAISIVAYENIREKVWYHTCNSKGIDCNRRQLVAQGGCCIWYNEPGLLAEVETRLHQKIPSLTAAFELPDELASLNIVYGEDKMEEETVTAARPANSHYNELKATVEELAIMEYNAQNIFLTMQIKFRK